MNSTPITEPPPRCVCGIPSRLREVLTNNSPNKGRWFYGCARWTPASNDHCTFFQWVGPPQPPRTTPQPSPQPSPPTTGPRAAAPPSNLASRVAGLRPRALQFSGTPAVAVTLEIVSRTHFGAKYPFAKALNGFIRSLPVEPRWNPSVRAWVFPLHHYEAVLHFLRNGSPVPLAVHPIPSLTLARARGEPLSPTAPSVAAQPHASPQQRQQQQHLPSAAAAAGPTAFASPQQQQYASPSRPNRTSPDEVNARYHRLPQEVLRKLYSFQRAAVRFGLARGGRILLADDMGLGKTVQALALAACYAPEDWPLLIVTPATMKLVWQEAVRAWVPAAHQPAPENLLVLKDARSATEKLAQMAKLPAAEPRVVIASYDTAKMVMQSLLALGARTIICDESHQMKSFNSQRTKAMVQLVGAARRAIFLSGTPALSRPVELYPQVNMLRPGLLGSMEEYGMRYCAGKQAANPQFATYKGMDFRGASCVEELRVLLESEVLLRRTKQQVLKELPEKFRKRIPIEAKGAAHLARLAETKAVMADVERAVDLGTLNRDAADRERRRLVTELFRRSGPAKVEDVQEHVWALLEAGEKVIVFAHHQEVLDALEEKLSLGSADSEEEHAAAQPGPATPPGAKKRTKSSSSSDGPAKRVVRIDGNVANERRMAAVDAFQSDPRVKIALLSITAAGQGITLTEATVVVFAELWWNPGSLIQAEDRAHRLGQRDQLKIHYMTAEGTADDLMWRIVKDKLCVVSSVLGGRSSIFSSMQLASSAEEHYVRAVAQTQSQHVEEVGPSGVQPHRQQQQQQAQQESQRPPLQRRQRQKQHQATPEVIVIDSLSNATTVVAGQEEEGEECES